MTCTVQVGVVGYRRRGRERREGGKGAWDLAAEKGKQVLVIAHRS